MTVLVSDKLQEVAGRPLLLQIPPLMRSQDWAHENRDRVEQLLNTYGAVLVRGFNFLSSRQFGQYLQALFEEDLAEYSYRSTPRTKLGGNVYTATEYHPSQTIPQHNESSYASAWPMRIGFLCMVAPGEGMGGATPLADSRAVLARIPSEVVARFEDRQIQYVRNYGSIDLPWSEVFQTSDRAEVETFCLENGISFEWTGENGLRTRQVTPATAVHPVTGEKVWFNQANLFHVSALEGELRRDMLSLYREEDLPRNVYFGDGSPIDVADMNAIRGAYDEVTFHFPWQSNDLILLDNMLFTHGRQPYAGERRVLVGMACIRTRKTDRAA
ncbi:TauD/TfdA family dioxygenase [Rhodanobacter sp. MP1X3]|uniref:TauD/TfdA family dioxygenase n=1 Tax=Rhodanobacter sp. MP1X3 TaxID=2723086 RepID=UPI001612FBFB|nr:TauD/TfdA family dioxygenase [Rhodanobacter sp. MP1X3]MBB6244689.1 alpha-ketoglutarate-dependent taurine dioxygenase [Rhodanobacter sp. MP1X3]